MMTMFFSSFTIFPYACIFLCVYVLRFMLVLMSPNFLLVFVLIVCVYIGKLFALTRYQLIAMFLPFSNPSGAIIFTMLVSDPSAFCVNCPIINNTAIQKNITFVMLL